MIACIKNPENCNFFVLRLEMCLCSPSLFKYHISHNTRGYMYRIYILWKLHFVCFALLYSKIYWSVQWAIKEKYCTHILYSVGEHWATAMWIKEKSSINYEVLVNPFLFIKGISCPRSVQTSLTQNCLKLTIPGFPHSLLPVSCGAIGFKKSLGQVLTWKSGRKGSLLPLRPSCSLQTILLSHLVETDRKPYPLPLV